MQATVYPEFRYMGSKRRLLPWIHGILDSLDFETAIDPFSGSGSVAYLMKSMGRRVVATDFLNFASQLSIAAIENSRVTLSERDIQLLGRRKKRHPTFIQDTYAGIFFKREDLEFLDSASANIEALANKHAQALARSALIRACMKRQPRGVFTVSGDLSRYDDGRRDLRLSIEEHFTEQAQVMNGLVFSNGRRSFARQADVFDYRFPKADLVYLDPPYVPRSDDNCYVKRYHFLEGLSQYWRGLEIDHSTKVRKIRKKFTPFSYRRTAAGAFNRLFQQFKNSTIVLSYSSNGFPNLDVLVELMSRYKTTVTVHSKAHRYHFGTHSKVQRAMTDEYLIVGTA